MNDKIKIMFLLPSFRSGGVEKNTLNIINSLNENYDIYLLVCTGENSDLYRFIERDISFFELKKRSVFYSLRKILILTKKIRPHILFTSFNHLSMLNILLKEVCFREMKSIIRINSLPSNKLKSNKRGIIYEMIFKHLIFRSDVAIAQSEQMKEDIIEYYSLPEKKIKVIHNLINSKQILKYSVEFEPNFDYSKYNLVAVGSLGKVKGFEYLIRAIKLLIDNGNNDLRLYIIGKNREKNEDYYTILNDLVKTLNLESYVSLLGFKSNPYPYIKRANAFVLSSVKEGFPNVVLEAITLKTPCVVTDCVDFSAIIRNGMNGIVVKKGDEISLAKGIERIKNQKINYFSELENFDFNKWFIEIVKI